MPQLKVQNFYSTTITSDITGLGDTSFTVAVPPTYTTGYLVISPSNIALREIVFFHNVVGSTVSVRAENRGQGGTTAKLHTNGEAIAMKDVSEVFNFFSDSLSQCFFVEKTGGLTVNVWGGTVFYNGNPVTVSDTALTLVDNQTNYIKYSYPTNTISADTTNAGNIKARVIIASGVITSIQYYVAKESYIDFTVSITGALPSQSGNAGKFLQTDGTIVSWQDVPNASSTVKGITEMAIGSEIISGSATGGTGAPLSISPDQLLATYYFGNGSDGNVVISTNTSLTRDMHYNNLTVNTGITLDPAGYAIYVRGTLTLTGTASIARNGNNATSASGVSPGVGGAALNTGSCGICLGGLNGGTGWTSPSGGAGQAGGSGVSVNPSYAANGTTPAGGTGGISSTSSAGGTSSGATHTRGPFYNTVNNLSTILTILSSPARVLNTVQYGGLASSGAGGAGGSNPSSGHNSGGGGGSGGNGGNIIIYANILAGTGSISATGGNGGNGGNAAGNQGAGGGGGGSGGNGGLVFLVYKSGTPWTMTLTAGSGGSGGGSTGAGATAGAAGGTGTVGQSIILQV